MGMADTNPNNVSTNDDNISSNNGNNLSSDNQKNNTITSPEMTSTINTIKTVATSSEDPDTSNNADISLTQFASDYYPNYLKTVTISIVVTNNGPTTSQNVILQDIFNQNFLKYISDDSNGAYNYQTGIWNVGNLDNSASKTLNVVEQIIASDTTIYNSAYYLSSTTVDNNPTNDQAYIYLIVPSFSDVSIIQTPSTYHPIYLHTVNLKLLVRNNGPDAVTNVFAYCLLKPKLFMYISDDGKGSYNYKTGVWTIGTLSSGSEIVLNIKTKIMAFRTKINYKLFSNQVSTTSAAYDISQLNNKALTKLVVPRINLNSLAASLAYGVKSKYYKAVNIFNWVRDHCNYSFYYGTRYGATGTLKKLKGNCVDLSRLIVALARHTGLHARYVYGTCYFLVSHHWISHVWANIYVRGRWYSADASNTKNFFGVIKSWKTSNYIFNGVYKTLPF
jgi:uncharacterized repeat protein (TIGR01451 family)